MIQINKTASNVHFNEAEMDKEINFSTALFQNLFQLMGLVVRSKFPQKL